MAKMGKSRNPYDSKIIVTGGAGFIGAYLASELLRRGVASPNKIVVVDNPEAFESRICSKFLRDSGVPCVSIEAFLAEVEATGSLGGAQFLFHMGASSSTEEMRRDYLKLVNVDYSKSLWNWASRSGFPFFYASSAATYGDGVLGFSDDPGLFSSLKPLNPYGESKLEFDRWVVGQSLTPTKWAGFRFFNVYGPGEDHKGSQGSVVHHARKQILNSGSLKLFKSHREGIPDGEQKRDFIFVGDVVEVMIHFMTGQNWKNGIFNLGTGRAQTFLELAHASFSALGLPPKIDFVPTPEKLRTHYQYFTQADLTGLRSRGNFSGRFLDLEAGVKKTFNEILKLES